MKLTFWTTSMASKFQVSFLSIYSVSQLLNKLVLTFLFIRSSTRPLSPHHGFLLNQLNRLGLILDTFEWVVISVLLKLWSPRLIIWFFGGRSLLYLRLTIMTHLIFAVISETWALWPYPDLLEFSILTFPRLLLNVPLLISLIIFL